MIRSPLILFLVLALLPPQGRCDEEKTGNESEYTPPPGMSTEIISPPDQQAEQVAEPQPEEISHPPSGGADLRANKGPFDLQDKKSGDLHPRFIPWVQHLCKLAPVAEESAQQFHTFQEKGPRRLRNSARFYPNNKQGSLLLLLDNFTKNISYRDDCKKRRLTNSKACRSAATKGQQKIWLGNGHWEFPAMVGKHSAQIPATGLDLLEIASENLLAIREALKKEFPIIRDFAHVPKLDPNPDSEINKKNETQTLAAAQEILSFLNDYSNCKASSVRYKYQSAPPNNSAHSKIKQ